MKKAERVVLEIPAVSGFEKLAMVTAESLARGIGFPEERVQDLRMAIGEACANAIEHGAQGTCEQRIEVAFSVASDSVEVEVRDSGEGIASPPAAPVLAEKLSGDDPSSRGWGFHIIRNLVDEFSVESEDQGTVVRMVIRIGGFEKEN